MDYISTTVFLLTITILLHHFLKNSPKSKLPPGPKPWPIIGNLHLLGSMPHLSVANLSKIHGPLMSLKLGSITTIVVSSANLAREMFTKHDLAFSSRHIPDAGAVVDHDKLSMIWLPVCPKWRDFRKILTIQLFTNQRLDANQSLRREKVDELVRFARSCCEIGVAIDVGRAASTTSLNLLSNTFFSMDFSSYDTSSVSQEFFDLSRVLLEEALRPNLSDFFLVLRPLDLQGIKKRQTVNFYKMLGFFERIIEERQRNRKDSKEDVLANLLKLVEENELTIDEVKHLLVDMFIAGSDTTSSVFEWAMTELLCHPETMTKAQVELDQVIGNDRSRSIQESDIPNLPYVQAIVKETLRLHPPAPFLIPHKLEKDIHLSGYVLPKNAQLWMNVWSISRDPSIWVNPESFLPERFLDTEIDVKGRNFEVIPFGAGRRMCPGITLAHRMLHLMLASLLYSFNWKLDNGISPEEVDMQDKWGLSLQKLQPLKAIPLPRSS